MAMSRIKKRICSILVICPYHPTRPIIPPTSGLMVSLRYLHQYLPHE